MQGHAERDPQQACRHHRDPGREVAVVNMNVLHSFALEPQGVAGAQQCVQQRPCPPRRALAPWPDDANEKIRQRAESPNAKPGSANQQQESQRLQIQGLRGQRLRQRFLRRGVRAGFITTRAAGNDFHSAPAQLVDFLEHVRLDRRRELIGEISDDWHCELRHIQRGERSLLPALLESRDWEGWGVLGA